MRVTNCANCDQTKKVFLDTLHQKIFAKTFLVLKLDQLFRSETFKIISAYSTSGFHAMSLSSHENSAEKKNESRTRIIYSILLLVKSLEE